MGPPFLSKRGLNAGRIFSESGKRWLGARWMALSLDIRHQQKRGMAVSEQAWKTVEDYFVQTLARAV